MKLPPAMVFTILALVFVIFGSVVSAGTEQNLTVVLIHDDPGKKPGEIKHISNDRVNITHLEIPHDWDVEGAWTFFPLIRRLSTLQSGWVLFVNQKTKLNHGVVHEVLSSYDENESLFIGYALKDESSTVIHHYSPDPLSHPLRNAGFLLSRQLTTRLSNALRSNSPSQTFSIDAAYEFAAYLNDVLDVQLIHDSRFCLKEVDGCFTSVNIVDETVGGAVRPDELAVAVKTYSGFHHSRIPVVKQTWGRDLSTVLYFSDKEDSSIPTISTGLPNTERGHCSKTAYILNYFHDLMEDQPNLKWLLIADDDTVISLSRLRRLLSNYNVLRSVILGDRYGYGWNERGGYDYITGGGGMVFSRAAVEKLVLGGCTSCPSDDTPDDMYLGACAKWQKNSNGSSRWFSSS